MVDMHESVRLTGMPYLSQLGDQFKPPAAMNSMPGAGQPALSETVLPFTRFMGGPMDYTPGIFQDQNEPLQQRQKEQVHTTLCKQLALYVSSTARYKIAADLPENYEAKPDAFQFIRDVATDWDDTKILAARRSINGP